MSPVRIWYPAPVSSTVYPEMVTFFVCLAWRTNKKGRSYGAPAFLIIQIQWITGYFFLRLSLDPIRPTKPVPKRSMVAGSGTGFGGSGVPGISAVDAFITWKA